MPAIKRIFFFVLSNIAILVTIGILVTILQGVFHIQIGATLDSGVVSLLIYSAIYGFAGSLISLAISRMVVKWTMGIKLLNETRLLDYDEKMQTVFVVVSRIAKENGISMPEVGIYESLDPNAFATGPTKNRALVAVSTGLLTAMTKQEIEGVIGHEMSHVLNGDMVTMTLLQ
jgi:heat shock protein HtpX